MINLLRVSIAIRLVVGLAFAVEAIDVEQLIADDLPTTAPSESPSDRMELEAPRTPAEAIAMYRMGVRYEYGYGVVKDYQQAMGWYRKSADGGDVRAMDKIGTLYADGRGVSQDYGEAMKWWHKAADAGDAVSMYCVGMLYESGQRVTQDYEKAKAWYGMAAANGNKDAKKRLADLDTR